jgi:transketolase
MSAATPPASPPASGPPERATPFSTLDTLAINTIRTLSMDAVQKANSGHPGTPMGLAPAGYLLWQRYLRYDPLDPTWPNRDRFVLSVGHASMLLYSLLHLAEVRSDDDRPGGAGRGKDATAAARLAVSLDDIKQFRQLDSRCPGHPEFRITPGVETTTGPLGQGVANSVGMAMAERWLESHYNQPDCKLFDYRVYALCGDGDMMEGISSEAASLAGHLKLGNLCWIYDSNRVTIEGHTDLAFSEDVGTRFLAYGWNVMRVPDVNDATRLGKALDLFLEGDERPTLIIVDSHIGYGSPHKQDSSAAHGEPLGVEEIRLVKRAYGWPEDASFLVPDGVLQQFRDGVGARGKALHQQWTALLERYTGAHPQLAAQLQQMHANALPEGWDKDLPVFAADAKGLASRDSSAKVLNAIAPNLPWLLGGAADLAPSTKTRLTFEGAGDFQHGSYGGRNLHFGIREHVMGAIANGLALSGLRPYASTFLIFSDYMKPPIRLSAIMEVPVIYVFTHDSIGVGEDGPTHQPVEQLTSLRSVPGLMTLRPADANEVAEAWRIALSSPAEPSCLVLSRQALPTLDRSRYASAKGVARGAYVLAGDPAAKPEVILLGTGSEVSMCIEAYEKLVAEGIAARVVSMPSWDLFEKQDEAYRHAVLPPDVTARVGIEQAGMLGWERYTGAAGSLIAMHTFGASAPLAALQNKFGFSGEQVYEHAKHLLAAVRR